MHAFQTPAAWKIKPIPLCAWRKPAFSGRFPLSNDGAGKAKAKPSQARFPPQIDALSQSCITFFFAPRFFSTLLKICNFFLKHDKD
jgi:hypothetical protein